MELKMVSTHRDKREAMADLARSVHHIDRKFVSQLRLLNELSLFTTQCCSGHEDAPGEEPGSGFRRAHFRFRSPHPIGMLTEQVFMPMLMEAGEDFLGVDLAGETGELAYVMWLDNKMWKSQVERFIKLYRKVDYLEPFTK